MKRNFRRDLKFFLRIPVAILCILFLIDGSLNLIRADKSYKDNIEISEAVEPLESPNASDLLDVYEHEGPIVTVPEGEPLPVEPPPERQPIFDPAIQLEERDLTYDVNEYDLNELITNPDKNFSGITSFANPPDTVMDVGPNHIVQMVNATQFRVWDKNGNPLTGVLNFGSLWPASSPCSANRGDPIVVYDHLADRWLLSQFAFNSVFFGPFWECIAVSKTPDPTASYHLYTFPVSAFPDYPKFGVWPDGYYMSTSEESNLGIFVFDRANMLLGNPATFQKKTIPALGAPGVRSTRILPSDLDGPPPPAGSPNYFVRTVDNQQNPGTSDRIEVYAASVNWSIPSFNFSLANTLTPSPFQIMLCNRNGAGGFNATRDCIPQPDTSSTVDALSNRPMMQLKYRNFGSFAAMVFNQTIDVSASIASAIGFTPFFEVAGIRWYELRKSGANWTIQQQGTYTSQPPGVSSEAQLLHRWMGSAAIDKLGNIALGYSITNDDNLNEVFPGIRYTGHRFDDPPGLMAQGEKTIRNGTNSQTGGFGRRWGDYSALSVDPVDDCTFWYTTHVAGIGGTGGRPTQISSFRFDNCAAKGELAYTPVTPCKIVDTRNTPAGMIGASTQRNFYVRGSAATISAQGGNPAGCTAPLGEPLAAHINMVAVDPTGKGNLKAFPKGAGSNAGLSVNYNTIDTNLANAGTVKTSFNTGSDITVASKFSSAHVTIQVLGYYYPDGDLLYSPVTPCKLVDTRNTSAGMIGAGTQRNFYVRGSAATISAQGGNPAGCTAPLGEPLAAHINMVAVDPTGKGNVKAFPKGAGSSAGLSVNYNTIDTNLANAGTVKTSFNTGSDITVASNFSSAHVTIQVLGYYYPDGDLLYSPVTPCKIVDTRNTSAGMIGASTQRNFFVRGSGGTIAAQGGNPAGCPAPLGEPLAAHMNMVAVDPIGKGNLKAFPVGAGATAGLSVNYNAIDTNLANAGTVNTITGAGPDITVASNFSSAHVTIQVLGYYYPAP